MAYEIVNKIKGPSYIRCVDAGTYTITLNELRANTVVEANVNTAIITEFGWSTSGFISITRGGVPIYNVTGTGVLNDRTIATANLGANTKTGNIVIVVNGLGTALVQLKKEVTYNSAIAGVVFNT